MDSSTSIALVSSVVPRDGINESGTSVICGLLNGELPRIRAELADQGVVASRKRIAAVMRCAQIRGVSRRRGNMVTTIRDKRQRPAPDFVKRQFAATKVSTSFGWQI